MCYGQNRKSDSPKGQETTTTDYFASSGKLNPNKSMPVKVTAKPEAAPSKKTTPKKSARQSRQEIVADNKANEQGSSRKKTRTASYENYDDDEIDAFLD